jgi:hypothetical protein
MPRQAEWLQQVPAALKALEHLTAPVIDRATLEKLLRIHRRAAIRLMHRFGGYQAGKTFLVDREALVRHLEQIAAGDSYRFETRRRERLVSHLTEVRRDLAQRRITIQAAPDVMHRELGELPPTIRLAPGQLTITCIDAQDLLRQLMELAQAIANDFEKFERQIGNAPTPL